MKDDTNYDRIAPFYDDLARMVFGSALLEIQKDLLAEIPEKKTWLIVGGGTGAILPHIYRKCDPQQLFYLEASEKMLTRARQRMASGTKGLTFLHGDGKGLSSEIQAEVIFTPFLLDNYTGPDLDELVNRLADRLKPGGLWLACDFEYLNSWLAWPSKLMVKLMYAFFHVFAGLRLWALPDWPAAIEQAGLIPIRHKHRWKGFISVRLFLKA